MARRIAALNFCVYMPTPSSGFFTGRACFGGVQCFSRLLEFGGVVVRLGGRVAGSRRVCRHVGCTALRIKRVGAWLCAHRGGGAAAG